MGAIVTQNVKDLMKDTIDSEKSGVFIGIFDEAPILLINNKYLEKTWAKLGSLGKGKNSKEVKLTEDELKSFLNKNKDRCLIIDPKNEVR